MACYVLTALQFMVSAFFEPARAAILPSLVEDNELITANTLASATWSAVLAFGAAIGGLTANIFGVEVAIVVDALTYVVSAFLIMRITFVARSEDDSELHSRNGWTDFIEGFKYVRERPKIGVFTFVKGLAQFGSVDIMFALYAERVFVVGEDGAITLGILYTFFGIGSVLGPVVANMLGDGSERFLRQWIWAGFLLLALGWIGFSSAPLLVFAAIAIMLRGMGGAINWTYSSVILQLKTPDRFLGRVFALDFSIFTLCYALSVWVTGFVVDTFELSPRELSLGAAILSFLPVIFWTFILRWQREAPQPLAIVDGD